MFLNRGKLFSTLSFKLKGNTLSTLNTITRMSKINSIRLFGTVHAKENVPGDDYGEHGHGHGDEHGHGHGHHEITGEVDLNKTYVDLDARTKDFVSLTGISALHKKVSGTVEGDAKARNATTPIGIPLVTRSRIHQRDLANVPMEENPYFHPEPYGYLIADDPWDPNPQTWQPTFLVIIGFAAILFLTRMMYLNSNDKTVIAEQIYHAHYTANLIEDEIRRIRKEDYPLRKLYDQLKNPGQEQETEPTD